MNITVEDVIVRKVNINRSAMNEVFLKRLAEISGLKEDQWLDSDGFVCEDEPHYHGSISTTKLRKATDLERAAYLLRRKLG